MKFTHITSTQVLNKKVTVAVIGAGGTGSALISRLVQLHYALLATGHPHGLHVEVWDDDTVSPANIGRQCFFPADVGQYKSLLLINRINNCWGTNWTARPRRLMPDSDLSKADIVIGCVDSRKARATILQAIGNAWHTYYIDSGNGENSGQVLLGQITRIQQKHPRLPHVGDVWPEMIDEQLDAADDKPSCSVAEALQKQSLVINNTMANEIFNLLWMLFHDGRLDYSGRFVNLKTGTSAPIRIDTEVWKRMGYVAPEPQQEPAAADKVAA